MAAGSVAEENKKEQSFLGHFFWPLVEPQQRRQEPAKKMK